jgi:hypothetical protein
MANSSRSKVPQSSQNRRLRARNCGLNRNLSSIHLMYTGRTRSSSTLKQDPYTLRLGNVKANKAPGNCLAAAKDYVMLASSFTLAL